MFQYTWYDPSKWTEVSVPPLPEDYISFDDISLIAPLYWAEHCVECAMPQCYGTCPNWEARIDRKCRRFVYGIRKTPASNSFCASLKLKKWGKIESHSPKGHFITPKQALRMDRLNYSLSKEVLTVSKALKKLSPTLKPSGAVEHLKIKGFQKIGKQATRSDFLFSAYLHDPNPVVLFFEIVCKGQTLLRKSLELQPGYNQILFELPMEKLPENALYRIFGSEDTSCELSIYFAHGVVLKDSAYKKLLPTRSEPASKVKCVVWDLDNTLWDGILIESAPNSLRLREHVAETLQWLDERGIIQCVASKNTHGEALAELKRLGVDHYFVDLAINWRSKSLNLAEMAKSININLNTFAFVDDSPFERAQIKELLPCVRVYEETQLASFADDPAFRVPVTEESRQRRQMYQTEYKRREYRSEEKMGQVEFLRSCKLRATLCHITTEQQEQRALELIQRTNQLNLSGRRYSPEEFHSMLEQEPENIYTLFLEDRFGSYGQAMVMVLRDEGSRLVIQDLAISCRIAGKYVESALFKKMIELYGEKDLYMFGHNSKKNHLLIETLTQIGFSRESDPEEEALVLFRPKGASFLNDHIVETTFAD